jgi:hypothetical protein
MGLFACTKTIQVDVWVSQGENIIRADATVMRGRSYSICHAEPGHCSSLSGRSCSSPSKILLLPHRLDGDHSVEPPWGGNRQGVKGGRSLPAAAVGRRGLDETGGESAVAEIYEETQRRQRSGTEDLARQGHWERDEAVGRERGKRWSFGPSTLPTLERKGAKVFILFYV